MRRERKKRTISANLPYLILWFLRLWRAEDMSHSVLICLSEHEARGFFFKFKKQTITNDITILKPCCFSPICPLLLYLCVNVIPSFLMCSIVCCKAKISSQYPIYLLHGNFLCITYD